MGHPLHAPRHVLTVSAAFCKSLRREKREKKGQHPEPAVNGWLRVLPFWVGTWETGGREASESSHRIAEDDGKDDGGDDAVEPVALAEKVEEREHDAEDGGEDEDDDARLHP